MHSDLFDQANREIADGQSRFALQNGQMLRVSLGPDVLATKGAIATSIAVERAHRELVSQQH